MRILNLTADISKSMDNDYSTTKYKLTYLCDIQYKCFEISTKA